MPSQLPAPRIVIASNDTNGKSVIATDSRMELFGPFGPKAGQFTNLFTTNAVPASNTAPLPSDKTTAIPRPGKTGTVFCTSDIPPHTSSPFHRTSTVDYMVVLKGEIVLRVDDEVEVTIKEGDTAVQRGTIHAWVNKTDEWCRMLCVMLAAEKVELNDGTILEDVFIPPKPSQ